MILAEIVFISEFRHSNSTLLTTLLSEYNPSKGQANKPKMDRLCELLNISLVFMNKQLTSFLWTLLYIFILLEVNQNVDKFMKDLKTVANKDEFFGKMKEYEQLYFLF